MFVMDVVTPGGGAADQRRLVGALRVPVEQDVVFHQHGHGSQDEGEEEVEVDVVPGAVQLPVHASENTHR